MTKSDTNGSASKRTKNKTILSLQISQNPTLTDSPALKQSLFPNIPPTINFMLHNEMSAHQLHNDLRKHLKWKLSSITPAIVKRCARYKYHKYFLHNKFHSIFQQLWFPSDEEECV